MIYENLLYTSLPDLGSDGRLRIYLRFEDGSHKVMSFPKFVMENYLGRYLEENETVDHIDKNPLNNSIKNLRVMDRSEHVKNDVYRNKDATVKCAYCGKEFIIPGDKLGYRNRKDGGRLQSGYFCSRSCSGRYGAEVQNGRLKKFSGKERIIPEQYTLHDFGNNL